MPHQLVIITPDFIRRRNFRTLGRVALYLAGSLAVFLILFLFAWTMVSVLTGTRDLTPVIALSCLGFAGGAFFFGGRHLQKHGPQDWEKIAQKSERQPGMRLGRLSNQDYGQIGQGVTALLLSGPGWALRAWEEIRALVSSKPEVAESLERLRRNLAAREGWAPMKDFESHHDEIYQLVKLEILAVREILGAWHLHVTLHGTVERKAQE